MDYDISELRKQQKMISERVLLEDVLPEKIRTVGGFDIAYSGGDSYAAAAVYDYDKMELIEESLVKVHVDFPYIPTLLSFREYMPIKRVFETLKTKPDIMLINGQGIAHPYKAGLATHVGVLLDKPSIGVAQKKLVGEYERPGSGKYTKLFYHGVHVGWVYKSRLHFKPIFISPGHKISLETSLDVVLHCMKDHKLPEPLWYADKLSKMSKIKNRNTNIM